MSPDTIIWHKSSYSGGNGGNCVEVGTTWRKSSYSGQHGGDCVEVAESPSTVKLRDSRNPEGGRLEVPGAEWRAFLAAVRHSELD